MEATTPVFFRRPMLTPEHDSAMFVGILVVGEQQQIQKALCPPLFVQKQNIQFLRVKGILLP